MTRGPRPTPRTADAFLDEIERAGIPFRFTAGVRDSPPFVTVDRT